jgi:hypothetical protein
VVLADAPDVAEFPPREYDTWFTTGSWTTEAASASAFDQLVDGLALFRIYREVSGTLCQPRPGQVDRSLRIDRILVPTAALITQGWAHGAVGVELKRSGVNIGPPLAQAMDYVRGTWSVAGVWLQLGAVFLWPIHKQSGPLASVMAHQRIGSVSHGRSDTIKFSFGEEVILARNSFSGIRLSSHPRGGSKVGSR